MAVQVTAFARGGSVVARVGVWPGGIGGSEKGYLWVLWWGECHHDQA